MNECAAHHHIDISGKASAEELDEINRQAARRVAQAQKSAAEYLTAPIRGAAPESQAMQSQNWIFDDIARVAAGAVGALSGVRDEIEARLRDHLERVLAGMDLVSREEFEAVKAMAAKAREEQELLLSRIEALEARLAAVRQEATTNPTTPQQSEGKNDR